MAAKKIVQTPDFVNGLLRSADEIDKLGFARLCTKKAV